ncbi:hypothetical protein ACFLYU_05250 [Candidatus Dependentiae bacterium]
METNSQFTKTPSSNTHKTTPPTNHNTNHTKTHFAEIIESSLQEWTAQCWDFKTFPSFGSIVVIKSTHKTIFGIVHQVKMGSMDSTRYPFAYKKTEQELMREQPQIFEFLKTTFSCITIGYKQKGKIYYLLSCQPPKIHAFVGYASPQETREFFSSCNYLHLLFGLSGQIFNLEELLLAMINQQVTLNILGGDSKEDKIQTNIHNFIETYSLLVGNDYRRLKLFLQRLEPLLQK